MNLFKHFEKDRELMNREYFIQNRKERVEKIRQIFETATPVKTGLTIPTRPGNKYSSYKIPVEYVVFNHVNDRFASSRREYEANTGKSLIRDDIESQKVIEDFIWKSNETRNNETLENLLKVKQEQPGVINREGLVLDGNRRAALILKIYNSPEGTYKNINKNEFKYYEAIIIPEDLTDEDIHLIETNLQMNTDDKVEYNAIEKYLKVDSLYNSGFTYQNIVANMKTFKTVKEVEESHRIYYLMCEYLESIDAKDRFSLITKNKSEDLFIKLEKTLTYYNNKLYQTYWNPDDLDIEDLKYIAFNFIRSKYEGKDFRNLMGGQRDMTGVFADKTVWAKFKTKTISYIDSINKELESKTKFSKFNDIQERETYFIQKSKPVFAKNLSAAKEALNNVRSTNKPLELLEGSLDKLESIDMDFVIENYDKEFYVTLKRVEEKVNELINRVQNNVFNKG
jgi:hypothetical protein